MPACTHSYIPSNMLQSGSKLSNSQISQQHPSKIILITHYWHIIHVLNSFQPWLQKCLCKTNMALNTNQLQFTTIHTEAKLIIEWMYKAEKFDKVFKSFDFSRLSILLLPSINLMVDMLIDVHFINHCRQHHSNLC
jgi:hypothetical protein